METMMVQNIRAFSSKLVWYRKRYVEHNTGFWSMFWSIDDLPFLSKLRWDNPALDYISASATQFHVRADFSTALRGNGKI